MNNLLFYNIAGHEIIIETPEPEVTLKLLPTFDPFRELNSNYDNILFRFRGRSIISIPKTEPSEQLFMEDITFNVYQESDSVTVKMKMRDTDHYFRISAERETVITDLTLTHEYESHFLAYFIRAAFGVLSAYKKTLKIHGSVIEKNGKALVFLGKSGTGKSTHSRLWQQFVPGCTLLNDDEPLIRVMDNGIVRVFGAPWSGSTPCYRNDSAEVSAFVHLYQSTENKLTKITGLKAFTSLFQSCSVMRSSTKNRDQIISIVNDILDRIPVYRLENRPDREAVSLTETLIG
ncbi:MAG: hypothetical protein PHO13_04355 [Fermentimonas sp.]|jgi:hypothetical protein|nr:hypothetical protein [Fermentimonas sp.]NLC87107.1 hypothetical protein [Bacteroidales bacterium]MDD2931549.1 hypothetical protein [Fermentimonas sp.]MDD3188715.1 hypothetical protein [Fermentimonas sp.]MDD3510946.1 hypothetical protein [Fermentimonas sp.]